MLNSHAKAKCGHTQEVSALTMAQLADKIKDAEERECTRCRDAKVKRIDS